MKHLQVAFACLLVSSGLLSPTSHSNDKEVNKWHITPGGKVGAINSEMTEAGLITAFGKENVVSGEVDLGEGVASPGTILFPSDPFQRIEILWTDKEHRAVPKQAQIAGTAKSRWDTTAGISLTTSLKELERINGKPFRLTGFETDYSGTIKSWQGGNLEKEFHGATVIIRLRPTDKSRVTSSEFDTVVGSAEFSSDNSVMQKINPEIYQIIWVFR